MASPTTGIDPAEVQDMINKHQNVKDSIGNYINQARGTVESDLNATSSGQMIKAVNTVFDTWQGNMARAQGDLQAMIDQLTATKNAIVAQDEGGGAGVLKTAGS
jgi:hypothetical protein